MRKVPKDAIVVIAGKKIKINNNLIANSNEALQKLENILKNLFGEEFVENLQFQIKSAISYCERIKARKKFKLIVKQISVVIADALITVAVVYGVKYLFAATALATIAPYLFIVAGIILGIFILNRIYKKYKARVAISCLEITHKDKQTGKKFEKSISAKEESNIYETGSLQKLRDNRQTKQITRKPKKAKNKSVSYKILINSIKIIRNQLKKHERSMPNFLDLQPKVISENVSEMQNTERIRVRENRKQREIFKKTAEWNNNNPKLSLKYIKTVQDISALLERVEFEKLPKEIQKFVIEFLPTFLPEDQLKELVEKKVLNGVGLKKISSDIFLQKHKKSGGSLKKGKDKKRDARSKKIKKRT